MSRVLCTLPNASDLISGVKFSATDNGMLSEEIDAAMVEQFVAIPGYLAVEHVPTAPTSQPAPAVPTSADGLPPVPPEPVGAEQGTVPAPTTEPSPAVDESVDPADDPAAESADAVAALRAEAEALGITVNNRWGEKRLQAEIAAKKAAA